MTVATDKTTPRRIGNGIGWTLLIALVVAVCIAISLAVQLRPEQAAPEPPQCGGLYTECCVEWDDNWGPCIDDDCVPPDGSDEDLVDNRGLFDAEENFADRRRAPNC